MIAAPHPYGGIEYHVDNHEIGHLHGSQLADLPFPKRIRDELVETGRAEPHHLLPRTGWVSYRITDEADTLGALALVRLNNERIVAIGRSGRAEQLPIPSLPEE